MRRRRGNVAEAVRGPSPRASGDELRGLVRGEREAEARPGGAELSHREQAVAVVGLCELRGDAAVVVLADGVERLGAAPHRALEHLKWGGGEGEDGGVMAALAAAQVRRRRGGGGRAWRRSGRIWPGASGRVAAGGSALPRREGCSAGRAEAARRGLTDGLCGRARGRSTRDREPAAAGRQGSHAAAAAHASHR